MDGCSSMWTLRGAAGAAITSCVLVLGSSLPVFAQETDDKYFVAFLGGISHWAELSVLDFAETPDPAVLGRPDTVGINLELSYHRRAGEFSMGGLSAGVDLGLFIHGSEGEQLPLDLVVNNNFLYVTPSLRWYFGEAQGTRFFVKSGFGYYMADIIVYSPLFQESARLEWSGSAGFHVGGGWISPPVASFELGELRLVAEAQAHFASFEGLLFESPNPGLKGPVYALKFGVGF